jgi:hypothetical protein
LDSAVPWHWEVVAGRGFTRGNSWSSAGFVDWVGESRPLARGFAWSPMITFGGIGGVPRFGDRYDDATWFAGAGARLYVWRGFFASFEIGAVDSQTPAFSSSYQFATSVGWSWEHLVITVRHISNAGLEGPNKGDTTFLAGVSF